jgi:protein-disulfide isomerase
MQGTIRTAVGMVAALLASVSMPGAAKVEIVEGNPNSPVRVMIYEDLQCGDCQTLRTLLDEKLLPRYGARVAFVHRDFPLPKHEWARSAALAGRWVAEQDRALGIRFRREILSEHLHLKPETLEHWLRQFALRNKLSVDGIVAALSDPRLMGLLEQDYQAALARGVAKTPTVFVANQPFVETIIYEEIARALDVELGH